MPSFREKNFGLELLDGTRARFDELRTYVSDQPVHRSAHALSIRCRCEGEPEAFEVVRLAFGDFLFWDAHDARPLGEVGHLNAGAFVAFSSRVRLVGLQHTDRHIKLALRCIRHAGAVAPNWEFRAQ